MFVALEFFEPFAKLLAFFYSIWPSYGGAISLFTLSVMIILTPLTLKGTRSMMVLQSLQPEMKKIQAQYKDDRQKLNEELLKFYKENNINPLGGCLPLLVQIPVFIILYNVLRGLTATTEIVNGHEVFKPKYLDTSSKLYQALHSTNEMKSWGMDLSKSVTNVMSNDGFVHALPFIVIICVVAATSFVQQKQISGRNPAAASNPQQQMLMKLGPIMLTGISIIYQGGLVIYLLVSNLYRVGQQALISRTIYNTPEAKKLLEQQMKDAEARKKSGAAQGGFFKQLLGDAAPQLNKDRNPRASSNGGKNGGKAAPGPAKPPAAKANGGRPTPPKSRSAASRKKKKRK